MRKNYKKISRVSLGIYDCVFGDYSLGLGSDFQDNIEDLYTICIKDPKNILIIPNSIKKPKDLSAE